MNWKCNVKLYPLSTGATTRMTLCVWTWEVVLFLYFMLNYFMRLDFFVTFLLFSAVNDLHKKTFNKHILKVVGQKPQMTVPPNAVIIVTYIILNYGNMLKPK